MPTAFFTSSMGKGEGTESSSKDIATYQPSAFLTRVAVFNSKPSGNGRCMITGIEPILERVNIPFPILFAPALGQLILGNVNERSSPSFLNLGLPALFPVLSGFIHLSQAFSSRLRFCC